MYQNHLSSKLGQVTQRSELVEAVKQIVKAGQAQLQPRITYQLECIGLIQVRGNQASFICELYRLYFQEHIHLF
ncbi:MAG: AAA-like domain-containing protein [Nostoc sp. NMS1]|nr:AAA-like domain-containing protein [Nostoc sp. NMS1]MBN3994058.1 AAA-like domain-containing protein [Nostoc sp. NMS2]